MFDLADQSEGKRIGWHVYLHMSPETPPILIQFPDMLGSQESLHKPRCEKLGNTVSISTTELKWKKNTDFEEMFSKLS